MATMIKQTKEEISWAEIARAREMGVLDKLLAERDVIRFNLRSGTEVAIMVEKVEPGRAWMGFVDGVAERPMYERLLVRPVSWKESDARKWCNTDLVQDLPEDLVSIITPRTIRQTVEDKELVTTDLLWLHSATEFFGRRPWASGDDPTEEQLPVYKTERDRVKMWNGRTWPHYTRSVYAGTSDLFCLVYTDGAPSTTAPTLLGPWPPAFGSNRTIQKNQAPKGAEKGAGHGKTKGNQVAVGGPRHHDRTAERDHFSDLSPVGHAGAGTHRKLLRHKESRENDQHGRVQEIHLGGGRGVLPGNRSRRD